MRLFSNTFDTSTNTVFLILIFLYNHLIKISQDETERNNHNSHFKFLLFKLQTHIKSTDACFDHAADSKQSVNVYHTINEDQNKTLSSIINYLIVQLISY